MSIKKTMEIFKVRLHYKQVDYYGVGECKSYILIVGAKDRVRAEKIVNKKYKLVENIWNSPIGTFKIGEFTKVDEGIAKSEFIDEVFSSGDIGYEPIGEMKYLPSGEYGYLDYKPIIAFYRPHGKSSHKIITTENMRRMRRK